MRRTGRDRERLHRVLNIQRSFNYRWISHGLCPGDVEAVQGSSETFGTEEHYKGGEIRDKRVIIALYHRLFKRDVPRGNVVINIHGAYR